VVGQKWAVSCGGDVRGDSRDDWGGIAGGKDIWVWAGSVTFAVTAMRVAFGTDEISPSTADCADGRVVLATSFRRHARDPGWKKRRGPSPLQARSNGEDLHQTDDLEDVKDERGGVSVDTTRHAEPPLAVSRQ